MDKHNVAILKYGKEIIIAKPGTGRDVLILNRVDYISKTEEILLYTTMFKYFRVDWFKCILQLDEGGG